MSKFYQSTKACEECGGVCCKSLPGSYTPQDIQRLFPGPDLMASVRVALKTKKVCIDWWVVDDGEDLYFLRPQTVGCTAGNFGDPSGTCIHLTRAGCILSFSHRPHYCKLLKPKTATERCTYGFAMSAKHKSALDWKDTGLDDLVNELTEDMQLANTEEH